MTNDSNFAELVEVSDRSVEVSACPACDDALPDSAVPCPACAKAADDRARIQEALLPQLGTRYELKRRLGSGTFGEVYLANDAMLDRDVAIKRVRLDPLTDSEAREQLRERTIREAKTAAKLKHPHIVTVYDIINVPDTNFIVMEFIDGPTLGSVLKEKQRLDLDETLKVLGPTAQALDYAHENGVVHRDVKPANIMIEGSTGVKVTDFGIATSEAFTNLTAAGRIMGTPNYMSPEQARGDEKVDGRSDLFALGCVLFECLTGQKAFHGQNMMATLTAIVGEEPPAVDFESLGIHSDIGPILKRVLAKDPSMRFLSASGLIGAVHSLPRIEPPSDEADERSRALPPAPLVTRRDKGTTSSFDVRLQGTLNDTSAVEVIREVYKARHTGILHLSYEKVQKRIYFKKGNIVFANSDVENDRLGEFLIADGQIDQAMFDVASKKMKETGHRFGHTLTELGVLSREQREDGVRRQIEAIIYSVIQWEGGAYGFEALERPVEEDIVLELSTADLILGGVRQITPVERIRNLVGDLERVIALSDNPLFLYQKMTLTTSEGFVLSRVDGSATVNEIVTTSPLDDEETLRCLHALAAAGVVELGRKPARLRTRGSAKPEPKAEARKVAVPQPDIPKSTEEEKPRVDNEQAELLEEIAAKHASLETANHYELLSVRHRASGEEIKQAYYAMAKKYHPDCHYHPALKQVHGLLEELFGKMTAAYKMLSDSGSRRQYDGYLQARATARKPPQVRAKTHDPEQLTIPAEVTAARQYRHGKNHFERMEYFAAIQCLRDSVRLSPGTPSYRKLLAICLTKNPKWIKEAERHFLEVLKTDKFDIECCLGLAKIYEASNQPSRAKKKYETVLAYDPENTIAKQKLSELGKPAETKLERLKNMLSGAP